MAPSTFEDLVRDGMFLLGDADADAALLLFDEAAALDPARRGLLWQRGLAMYAVGKYVDAAEQFRYDLSANSADVEEVVWHAMCVSKNEGLCCC